MKKFLKSIPSILVAAQAIPMIAFTTSCGNVESKLTTVDLTKTQGVYTPTTGPITDPDGRKWLSQKDTTKLYISEVSKNPMIFVEDLFYATSLLYNNEIVPLFDDYNIGLHFTLTKCELGVSKPVFGSTRVWEIGFDDTEYNTISFEHTMELQYEVEYNNQKIIKSVSAGVEYQDIIFLPSEGSIELGTKRDSGWFLGFVDKSLGEDAFWMHAYNTNPWSISYHSTITEKKYVHNVHGDDDIIVDSASYYSGTVHDAMTLKSTYDYINAPQPNVLGLTKVERLLGHMLLHDNRFSHSLTDIINEPDVCVNKQLSFKVNVGSNQNIAISHIHLINCLSSKVVDPESYTIKLAGNSPTNQIVLQEITTDRNPRTITIQEGIPLVPEGDEYQNENYMITGVLDRPYESVPTGGIVTFSIPYRQLLFDIYYKQEKVEQEPIHTFANLHYNNIIGHVLENKN